MSEEQVDLSGLPDEVDDGQSKREKLHDLKEAAKEKTKHLLHLDSRSRDDLAEQEMAVPDLDKNPAFNPSGIPPRELKNESAGVADKTMHAVQDLGHAVAHPKETVKTRASKTVVKPRPYTSRRADLEFLDAYEEKDDAEDQRHESDDSATYDAKESQVESSADRVESLEQERLALHVEFITNKYVQRVKVVETRTGRLPRDSDFEYRDKDGNVQYDWMKWFEYVLIHATYPFTAQYIDDFDDLDEPPFNKYTFRKHLERLIVVSAPLQTFASKVRCVMRWEDPAVTGKWMTLYFVLWYFSHIMTYVYGYIIYLVVKNYYHPTSADTLRNSMARSMDRNGTAFKVTELMDKNGDKNLAGALEEEVGPILQMQCHDVADILEVIDNFYHWKSPAKTRASLFFFLICSLICIFGSTEFCVRIVYLFAGMGFFLCFPIASHYPQYRLLVFPLKWVFWEVPTHAEWSFQYLEEHSNAAKAKDESQNLDTETTNVAEPMHSDSEIDDSAFLSNGDSIHREPGQSKDVFSFYCTHSLTFGRFIVSTSGIRFESSLSRHTPLPSNSDFSYPFTHILEMRKRNQRGIGALSKLTPSLDKLEIRLRDPEQDDYVMGQPRKVETVLLENLTERDKAFNTIIGFSGLKWQNLQGGWE